MEIAKSNSRSKAIGRGRGRPAQALYMPPAQRNRVVNDDEPREELQTHSQTMAGPIQTENIHIRDLRIDEKPPEIVCEVQQLREENIKSATHTEVTLEKSLEHANEVIMIKASPKLVLSQSQVDNKPAVDKKKTDSHSDKDKTKNFKEKDVKCDVLQISLAKNIKKSPIKLVQVDQWEDLINEDAEEPTEDNTTLNESIRQNDDSDNENDYENVNDEQLEHILEIYDFPSTFKTPDIMQIYNELDQNSVYIKWLTDTRALLVLGSAMQAKRALGIENPFVKSRPVAVGSTMAIDAVRTSNLRPAMKRPQTSMHAARRMITTALGAKSHVSREVQQREREALRKAKEERRAQRQSERDAWEGNPRPTTA